jgi:hypothetical protein
LQLIVGLARKSPNIAYEHHMRAQAADAGNAPTRLDLEPPPKPE